MPIKRITLPDDLRLRFRNYITDRSGLYFRDHEIKNLEDAIKIRMEALNIDSAVSYYAYMSSSATREDEFRELLNLLTINHTYFFRNEGQFRALKEKVLPDIIERKRQNIFANNELRTTSYEKKLSLRIWSAGCSSGEEPYSLAMLVRDLIPDYDNWDIHILATDASSESLNTARRGIYGANSARPIPREYLDHYFDVSGFGRDIRYRIKDEIKSMVTLAFHNLIEDDFPKYFDIILCRNVVIYFDFDITVKIMSKFNSSLNDEGYFFIGYSETLQFMRDRFNMVSWKDSIYYRKVEEVRPKVVEMAVPGVEEAELDKIIDELSRDEAKAEVKAEVKAEPAGIESSCRMEDFVAEAIKAIRMKDYNKALSFVESAIAVNKSAAEPYYLMAEVYMNQSLMDMAKDALFTALKINPLFSAAHYLLGCLYSEENDIDNAKRSFKKALYLDNDFLLANFYLANIYKREGETGGAIREYRNTLKQLSKSSLQDIVAYSGGFNAATLINVCRDNLERLKLER